MCVEMSRPIVIKHTGEVNNRIGWPSFLFLNSDFGIPYCLIDISLSSTCSLKLPTPIPTFDPKYVYIFWTYFWTLQEWTRIKLILKLIRMFRLLNDIIQELKPNTLLTSHVILIVLTHNGWHLITQRFYPSDLNILPAISMWVLEFHLCDRSLCIPVKWNIDRYHWP